MIKTAAIITKFPATAKTRLALLLAAGLLALTGCASPQLQKSPEPFTAPAIRAGYIRFSDGFRLPLRQWRPERRAERVVLALHGFNDYSFAFDPLGRLLARRGTAVYAFDQRGFGGSPYRGVWPGSDRLVRDAVEALQALRDRHPDAALYLAGESMGGAVAMLASLEGGPDLAGLVLFAPAVWGRDSMSPLTRLALWVSVRTVPARRWTGEGLDITPTDNTAALRRMGRDPLVIKRTRTDALWGITNLMDRASAAAGELHGRTLVLYGLKDEVIPKPPTCRLVRMIAPRDGTDVLMYPEGYHLLMQDRQSRNVLRDVDRWIRGAGPPSPYRVVDGAWQDTLCSD